ncbi:MAG: hypothetical protein H0T87_12330 [Gammaproteobacteria bacterium]|nr:hypothetical protein [Gammaproteobacteria bacterium]
MSGFYLRTKCVAYLDARRGRRAALARCLLGGLLPLLLWPAGPASADPTVRPYTGSNHSNPPLDREQLRAIFFVRQTKWPNGTPVRVFVLPDRHALHIRFTKEVLGVYPYQLRSTWDRMVYSGTGVPPTVVQGVDEMRSRVDATPGGIGYLEE